MDKMVYPLTEMIDYRDRQIASRSLSRLFNVDLPVVLFALDDRESISNEQTEHTKLIHVLEGTLELTMEEESISLTPGVMMAVPPNTLHAILAKSQCKFLQMEVPESSVKTLQ